MGMGHRNRKGVSEAWYPWKYPSHLTETESTTCAIIPEAERITGLYSDSSTVTAEPEKEREEEEPHLL